MCDEGCGDIVQVSLKASSPALMSLMRVVTASLSVVQSWWLLSALQMAAEGRKTKHKRLGHRLADWLAAAPLWDWEVLSLSTMRAFSYQSS